MSAIWGSLNILCHCLSLELEWKLTFFCPVATADFSKFAGILNAAFSQHHLSGFEIAQLEFHHLHSLFIVMFPKAHLTLPSKMYGSRWVITPSWLSGSWRSFLFSSSVYSCHLFLISSASLRSSLSLCGSQQTVQNSKRDGNTRLPNLPLEKPVCRSRSNS